MNARIQGFEFPVDPASQKMVDRVHRPHEIEALIAALRKELMDHPEPLEDDGARQNP